MKYRADEGGRLGGRRAPRASARAVLHRVWAPEWNGRWACMLLLAVASCLPGCATLSQRDDYEVYRRPPERLHEVDALNLAQLSRSEPISVEQAAAASAAEALAVEEPAESLDLELAEVRAAALAHNLDLKVDLVNPSIARASVSEAQAAFEALLFGSLTHQRSDSPPSSPGGVSSQVHSTSTDLGVQIPLRTGGTVTVDVPFSRYNDLTEYDDDSSGGDTSSALLPYNPSHQAGLRFSISQPLLRGAGVRANTHYIRVAKYQRDIADARTKLAAINILAEADYAYWLLWVARKELSVRQEQYELALQQLDAARKFKSSGGGAEIEITRANSGVAARLEAIIIADTVVRQRERELERIMHRADLPLNSPTALIPMTEPHPVRLDLEADALAEYAVTHRMEMLELELRLAIDASAIDFERNARLPGLSLDYSYTRNGRGGRHSDAFSQAGDGLYADHVLGLQAEIPLGNRAAKSRWRRARLQQVQDFATREHREELIRQNVYDAIDALQQDWQRILAARQEVLLAGEAYEDEKKLFEVGGYGRTSTDVLEAAARIGSAQLRELRALAAYEISQVNIATACGALLGQNGVIWEPIGLD